MSGITLLPMAANLACALNARTGWWMLKSDAVPVPARWTDGSLDVLQAIVVLGCLLGGDGVGGGRGGATVK